MKTATAVNPTTIPTNQGGARIVVINADDLGLCKGINRAVARAYQDGILTSASLMANGTAFDHAVEHVIQINPGLGVGLHLCLTSGCSVLPPEQLTELVDEQGRFRLGFIDLLHRFRTARPRLAEQVEAELTAQFERAADAGVAIGHVDGHRYVHMIPAVFAITCRLASRFGCEWVRRPVEPLGPPTLWCGPAGIHRLRNFPKQWVLNRLCRRQALQLAGFQSVQRYHGILDSGAITTRTLNRLLRSLPPGVTEIAVHPALPESDVADCWSPADRSFVRSSARVREFEALVSSELTQMLDSPEYRFCPFSQIP